MTVLITGGYGFLGAWILRNLLSRGDAAVVYDLKEDPRRLSLIMDDAEISRVRFAPGDVTDLKNLIDAIARHGVTHIIHLAGLQVPTCREDPIRGAEVNVIGTLAVFEAARAAKLERVVYASSAAVFGPLSGESPLGDDALLKPSTHYGVFKACNEGNARVYFNDCGLNSIGLRPWTVYGPGRDLGMTSEPTKAIKAAMIGRPWHISFGGMTDFQFVDDVARIFLQCLDRPYRGARSYNLRGVVASVAEFRDCLIRVLPSAEELISIGTSQIAIAYDLSDAALERDFGPLPKTALIDGIRATVAVFRKLQNENRLDTTDLDLPRPSPTTVET